MFAIIRLPADAVLMAIGPADIADMLRVFARCAVVREAGGAFERLPEGERNPEQYFHCGQESDPRMVALRAEARAEGVAELARVRATIESFVSGGPVEVDRPLAAILPHKPKDEAGT